ncbi:MAG: ABC transporter permease [Lachnospiraceae bacterium]|nr:ABC transporter permease [Lachnospiraceae bacterium]
MAKYILKRSLHGIVSIIIVTGIVMLLVYSLMSRDQIFKEDPLFTKVSTNRKVTYKYEMWEKYGYLDYVNYTDWLTMLEKNGEIDSETRQKAVGIGKKPENDSAFVAEYVQKFTDYYTNQGYEITRLNAVSMGKKTSSGGQQQLFAAKDRSVFQRLLEYFTKMFRVDGIHSIEDYPEERGIEFTWYDPVYGGEKFSPAILGKGTYHRYLFYIDDEFPFIHQNILTMNLGLSYSVNQGIDITTTMTQKQGGQVKQEVQYPSGLKELSADDLHTATYSPGSQGGALNVDRFTDDYTNVNLRKDGMSRMGYSFLIGILSTILSYLIGVPVAIWMAQKKDKLVDQIGSVYVVFITAMPSLAYIFIVKAIGNAIGIPTTFVMDQFSWTMLILPIISLALRPIGGMMRWLRRFMVDQQNADYVKFARSGGLSEGEIFRKHIFKNAVIPIVHDIPGAVLFSLVGALITERVYVVPGVGGLLVNAIQKYDNGVIVGVALFYAALSVASVILGDVMMSMVDPRINFNSKAR